MNFSAEKTVFMFPGQGSQVLGMGQDLHQEYDFVRELFDMVEDVCKKHIRGLCFNGPMEDLTQTVNLQPAVTAVNLACLAAITNNGLKPGMVSGHSLGEYSALCASGVLLPEDIFKIVFKRGKLMHRDSRKNKGAMAAIIGLEIKAVAEIVEQASDAGVVSVANHNTLTQIVITGSPKGVEKASALASEHGARAVPLKVSGAWHSEFMQDAKEDFAEYLLKFPFKTPEIPVVMNMTGKSCSDAQEIFQTMAGQLISPVNWCGSLLTMAGQGVETFVEVGPQRVLAGMVRKVLSKDRPFRVYSVGDMRSLEKFLKAET